MTGLPVHTQYSEVLVVIVDVCHKPLLVGEVFPKIKNLATPHEASNREALASSGQILCLGGGKDGKGGSGRGWGEVLQET